MYRYFDGRPPALETILERPDSFACTLWRETDLSEVFEAPAQLSMAERFTLFSIALGRRPRRALEIASFRGGSARIIIHAMDLNDYGELVMIDPNPQLAPGLWDRISHRARLIEAPSPLAVDQLEGSFDFVFIDGDHAEEGVRADLLAVAPKLEGGAVILLHDVLYPEARKGIDRAVNERPDLLYFGPLCTNASHDRDGIPWAGLGMIRKAG